MVSDFQSFTNRGCNIAAIFFVCGRFFLTEQDFFGIGATIHIGREILCLQYAGLFMYNIFDRPSVAEAVLQTALQLIHSSTHSKHLHSQTVRDN